MAETYIVTLTPTGRRSLFKKREEWAAIVSVEGRLDIFSRTKWGLPSWYGYDSIVLTGKAITWFEKHKAEKDAEAARKARTRVVTLGVIDDS